MPERWTGPAGDSSAVDLYAPPQVPIVVVYRDRDLLVIDKPAGLLSVPGRRPGWEDSALSRVQALLDGGEGGSSAQGGLWAVHRLDMATSGLLVFALRRKAERSLRAQFAGRQIHKRYVAVVAGQPPQRGVIDLPLRRVGGWPPRNVVDPVAGLPARTDFEVVAGAGRVQAVHQSRLVLRPHTGRSHQLRVHLAASGWPILGDRFYAPPTTAQAASRLMLHAEQLDLTHPFRGESLCLLTPAPF